MKLLLVFLLQLCCLTSGFKYLVYNVKFSRSHTIFMNKIADTLAKHGHEVINYQPIYSSEYNATGTKLAKTIDRELTFPIQNDQSFLHKFLWANQTFSDLKEAFTTGSAIFCKMFADNCRDQLQDTQMMDKLKAMKFDLFLSEYFDPCGLAISKRLGIKKHIGIYSMPLPLTANKILGLPSSLSFVPDLYASLTPKMTMFERVKNMISGYLMYTAMNQPLLTAIDEVAREVFDSNYEFFKEAGESSLVFVNTDELLDFPRPITHKVIYIGGLIGLNEKKAGKLPESLEKIYQQANKGVIYTSFGTVAPRRLFTEQSLTIIY